MYLVCFRNHYSKKKNRNEIRFVRCVVLLERLLCQFEDSKDLWWCWSKSSIIGHQMGNVCQRETGTEWWCFEKIFRISRGKVKVNFWDLSLNIYSNAFTGSFVFQIKNKLYHRVFFFNLDEACRSHSHWRWTHRWRITAGIRRY